MPEIKNKQLALFRLKISMIMSQHVDRMKIYLAEEKLAGSDLKDMRKLASDPGSSWTKFRKALNNEIKREVAGLINEIHETAYLENL